MFPGNSDLLVMLRLSFGADIPISDAAFATDGHVSRISLVHIYQQLYNDVYSLKSFKLNCHQFLHTP
jgi:hypothetical protein